MDRITARFSGHQSFPVRNTWLTKGVIACEENANVFKQDDALVRFGVGKNMVDSIKYWTLATRVLEINPGNASTYDLRLSDIGRCIFIKNGGWDRYLEDAGTIWLLHYLLVTNPDWATTAYYAFNELTGLEFTRDSLEKVLMGIATQIPSARASVNTIHRDVGVFIQMYAGSSRTSQSSVEDYLDCPLTDLGLIYEEPAKKTYAFSRGPKDNLPDEVIFYAIWEYARRKGQQRSFTFDELAYQPFSPGRIFKLDELALAERLEHIEQLTSGAWQWTETAGYRQLVAIAEVDALELLNRYYAQRLDGAAK
ncbi:MAG: hypothetical protein BWY63_00472 [Chloroflexi bacterium ADurb.Bin360]|nr:MAG: hypothetical protein BWY63_00472 [Chloroflexi bacterium ADurb.Bin360]